ncbi:hypothetical protein Tco_0627589 [Tanacetum coccineum]|uniref:Uncharacterized protein n=1 Tax=Tanacetum coccineum TaxID=301880 RepID=A0ABQ4WMT3_9ASTR
MLRYLAGMEPYYLKCIMDGSFLPKTVDGDAKPDSEYTLDERRGLRNANHTQTLDLANICGRFVYKENLIERSTSSSQNPKTLQPKNNGFVAETFDWDEEEVSDKEEVTQVKLKEEKTINEKWLTSSKKVSQCISEQIPHQKKKVLGGELFTESSSKVNENIFIPASMGILVPESQAVNESLKPNETSNTPESPQDSKVKSLTPLPTLKNLQGSSPSSQVMPLTFQPHSSRERPGLGIMKHTKPKHEILQKRLFQELILYCMICKREDHRTSDHEMYTTSLKRSKNYKAQPYQCASSSKQILKAKAKPFPSCTHCGFNDH